MADLSPEIVAAGFDYYRRTYSHVRGMLLNVEALERHLAGETYREIATDFGVSHQRVRQRVAKMQRCLRCWWAQTGRHAPASIS